MTRCRRMGFPVAAVLDGVLSELVSEIVMEEWNDDVARQLAAAVVDDSIGQLVREVALDVVFGQRITEKRYEA